MRVCDVPVLVERALCIMLTPHTHTNTHTHAHTHSHACTHTHAHTRTLTRTKYPTQLPDRKKNRTISGAYLSQIHDQFQNEIFIIK